MTGTTEIDPRGRLAAPNTLVFQRLLPGPVGRIWRFLTEEDLRRKWLAGGRMEPEVGAAFELVWRNDELTMPPGVRPDGFAPEARLACRITEWNPPRRLAFAWGDTAHVAIDLAPAGERVLLTLTHSRIAERGMRVMLGSGWHTHLDILADRLQGSEPAPFWDTWSALRDAYDRRLPA